VSIIAALKLGHDSRRDHRTSPPRTRSSAG